LKILLRRLLNNYKITQKLYLNYTYYKSHKRLLNLADPQTFTEKIQWAKINGNLEELWEFVDKFEVRNFVRKKIGEKYLIPLISLYNRGDELILNELPNRFILKATHSAGQNLIVIDKSVEDETKLNKIINQWLKTNYYHLTGESNYKHIKPRVVAEELITSKGGLKDYKFYCFYGEVIFVQVISDRSNGQRIDYFDKEWELLDLSSSLYKNSDSPPVKPNNFEEMLKVANELSSIFSFVRVDLYNADGKIYFGELTFTPANGQRPFGTLEQDIWVGSFIEKNDFGSRDY